MQKREKFSSRLGFLLISAGCAIGLGNVYRFPITAGSYGGAIFVLIYFAFLLLLGLPIMTAELAVGRASQRSIATSFDVLEKKGQKWHFAKYLGITGNYLLMMFYTTISGWILTYFVKYLNGSILQFQGADSLAQQFSEISSDTGTSVISSFAIIIFCFLICSLGLQNGVEKITKVMMIVLFAIMAALAIYSCTLPNAKEGLQFYLVPSVERMKQSGVLTIITSAMGQAFFTISVGIGSIAIFGSYINKERKLLGEAVTIISFDTLVALLSGLIIFPACFTFSNGITTDASTVNAGFVFTTLSSIFNTMAHGRIIGSLFFLLLLFASLSTVIAVFENIMSFWIENTKLSRFKISIINILLLVVLSLPTILSSGVLANIQLNGKNILDIEDFVLSNVFLPVGSIVYVTFCSSRFGWGFDKYFKEVNTGKKGISVPKWIKPYFKYVLPLIIAVVMVISIINNI